MRVGTVLVVAVAVLATTTGTAVAMDNTAPFAEAGLDQTVPPNTTVYLDANGSSDPDGDIAAVEWTVRTPGGDTRHPDCVDCRRTHFTASTVGRYTVTLTVTDDDGASSSDQLYVTVATDTGPEVAVAGPSTVTRDSDMTLTADVSRSESALQSVTWVINGSVVDRQPVDGNSATVDLTHSFKETGPRTVSAVVYDSMGERGSDTQTVAVTPETAAASGNSGGSSDSLCHDPSGLCGNRADMIFTEDGVTTIIDSNGKPGIQLFDGRDLTDYGRNLHALDVTSSSPNNEDSLKVEAGKLSDITTEDYETDDPMNENNSVSEGGEDNGSGDNGGDSGDSDDNSGDGSDSGDIARKLDGSMGSSGSDDDGDSGDAARKLDGSTDSSSSDGGSDNSSDSDDSGSDDSDGGMLGGFFDGSSNDGSSNSGGNDDGDDDGGGLLDGLL